MNRRNFLKFLGCLPLMGLAAKLPTVKAKPIVTLDRRMIPDDNGWHHVAFHYDPEPRRVNLYIDDQVYHLDAEMQPWSAGSPVEIAPVEFDGLTTSMFEANAWLRINNHE